MAEEQQAGVGAPLAEASVGDTSNVIAVPVEEAPKQQIQFRQGDWYCQACGNHNFAKRVTCKSCNYPKMTVPVTEAAARGYGMQMGAPLVRVQPAPAPRPAMQPLPAMRPAPAPQFAGGGGAPAQSGNRREGDWDCAKCGNHNFAYRDACKSCGAPKVQAPPPPQPMRPVQTNVHRRDGDWDCVSCGNLNFHFRTECKECKTPRGGGPHGGQPGQHQVVVQQAYAPQPQPPPQQHQKRPGDWDCWVCGEQNFASRTECRKCQTLKEKAQPRLGGATARPGDWLCMQCQNVNFSSRDTCKSCGADRATHSNEQILKRVRPELADRAGPY